ncbi:hypothetical protein SNOG_14551 [Parastagonospora nodorum SN15]|uniref:Uncharacterized protein n=1 Tax=Phaeosphaeria nodorum (strain SN15 / ATCC MYA-4574 / FGSC 10173) TaxID=321614 RepID=Q0U139_PHANO|nr:hypothetical protein SNOG_14551 [Parastagonospora nodorum SN15]EAT78091.1 hypothetical protein SNOG_14551 [Parastagonospora nodorum SN15]
MSRVWPAEMKGLIAEDFTSLTSSIFEPRKKSPGKHTDSPEESSACRFRDESDGHLVTVSDYSTRKPSWIVVAMISRLISSATIKRYVSERSSKLKVSALDQKFDYGLDADELKPQYDI